MSFRLLPEMENVIYVYLTQKENVTLSIVSLCLSNDKLTNMASEGDLCHFLALTHRDVFLLVNL